MTDILNWGGIQEKPSEELIKNGYKGGNTPQAEHFNYIFNNFSTCIKENRGEIQKNTEGLPIPDKITKLSEIIEPGKYIGNNLITSETGKENKYLDTPNYTYSIPPGDNQGGITLKNKYPNGLPNGIIAKEFIIEQFKLEVSKTPDDKIYQSFSFYDDSNKHIIFERFQTSASFGDWKNITPRTNRLLWSGCMYMQEGQSIDLSKSWQLPENQDKGIVLVWSYYDSALESKQTNLIYNFVPKEFFEDSVSVGTEGHYNSEGYGSAFFLACHDGFSLKWLRFTSNSIIGDITNNQMPPDITYNNKLFVLRYVIGV